MWEAGRHATTETARHIRAGRDPAAAAAVVAGSRLRGERLLGRRPHRPLRRAPAAHRESFVWEGIPVEAFVDDLGTLR